MMHFSTEILSEPFCGPQWCSKGLDFLHSRLGLVHGDWVGDRTAEDWHLWMDKGTASESLHIILAREDYVVYQ